MGPEQVKTGDTERRQDAVHSPPPQGDRRPAVSPSTPTCRHAASQGGQETLAQELEEGTNVPRSVIPRPCSQGPCSARAVEHARRRGVVLRPHGVFKVSSALPAAPGVCAFSPALGGG